ncbi:MAG: DUF3090 domain-containing protein [Actinomycetota bacterium]|nr:DUF3090 domain-containing protein [Actinomycetota bacterium]
MNDLIEFDPVDRITAGALGRPGQRTFLIQAVAGEQLLTVLVEKQQVAALSARLLEMLAALDEPYLEETLPPDAPDLALADVEPLFRARLMRLGFDPGREMFLLELYEEAPEDLEEWADEDVGDVGLEGHLARLFVHPSQARSMAARGAQAVAAGRPICRLCWLPMDLEGHFCPALN